MQSRTLLHSKVFYEVPLGEEICGKLNTRSETSTDHGWDNATVKTLDTLSAIDLREAIGRAFVLMLCADW